LATFKQQVAGLTGISSGTTPTDDELTEFLKDGVNDVTRRCIEAKPAEIRNFIAESSDQTSNGLNLFGAKIVSVVREAGVSNAWKECRYIPPGDQYRVTDAESLKYASAHNPAYTVLDNGKISVFPVPGADPNQFKVYYVNNIPYNKSGSSLSQAHQDIGIFPDDKVYLVVIYAAIKTLEAKMAEFAIDEEDTELVQAISSNLASLKQQYEGAFASMAPPQPQQVAGGRR
tara:strand:- start:843 stop:1532 length:690 start_codon:yes stop_codon:yes gene_type:complete